MWISRRYGGCLELGALALTFCSLILGCSVSNTQGSGPPGISQGVGGAGGISGAGGSGQTGSGGAQFNVHPDASTSTDAGTNCSTAVTCTPEGGQYCGKIGNGCLGTLDCGNCTQAGWVCENNLCVGATSCVPTATCKSGGTTFCGKVGDGCGHALDCGTCAGGESCTNGVCVKAGCAPLTCATAAGQYCGSIGDGCGGKLDCGACPNGGVCGGGGIDHVCFDPNCAPKGCSTANGGSYCGTIGDGCGKSQNCGGCQSDWTCQSNMCVGGASCAKNTCQNGTSKLCGTFSDGCGGTLSCASCAADEICKAGICIKSNCVPLTSCQTAGGQYCGTIGDGCGGILECGTCPNAGVCGGAGIAHLCFDPKCVATGCTAANGGKYCGKIGNGCGGSVDCGSTCPNSGVCGANTPNVCPGTGTGCTGIQCQVKTDCPNSGTTSLSGTVYDPAGINPIYNALVYIPNAPLDPVPTGASCDLCSATASGQPIANALTDVKGHFTLTKVPGGTNIPLVIQVGKWRRQVTIPSVTNCADNPITNKDLTRLPRTQSEGNIPLIALTTGGSDALECLLRRIGIADSEFTTDTGKGRVHLYYGGDLSSPTGDGAGTSSFNAGGTFNSAKTLWSSTSKMAGYDLQMYSCEGGQYTSSKDPYRANVESYMNNGGRVFLSHLHFNWLSRALDKSLTGTATYIGVGDKMPQPITGYVNTAFPKGAALADWMLLTGASTVRTELQIYQGQHSVSAVTAPTQSWISVPQNPNDSASPKRPAIQYMSFNTPVTAAEASKCGRVVLTDLHINMAVTLADGTATGGDNSDPSKPFPTGCGTKPMNPQTKALEFLFFDLSSCISPPETVPTPPPPPPGLVTEPPPPTTVPGSPPDPPPPPTDPPPPTQVPPPPTVPTPPTPPPPAVN